MLWRINRQQDCRGKEEANFRLSEEVGVSKMKRRELMKVGGGEEGSMSGSCRRKRGLGEVLACRRAVSPQNEQ